MENRHSPVDKRSWRRTIAALAPLGLALVATPPVVGQAGGLRATISMEVVRLAPTPDEAPDLLNKEETPNFDAMFAQMGEMLAKMIAPAGKVEMLWMGQDGLARSELRDDMLMMPAGSIVLMRDGEVYVIDPANRTYYAAPGAPAAGAKLGMPGGMALPKPEVTVTLTGQRDTLLGRGVERVDIQWRLPLAAAGVDAGLPMPPGFPTEMSLTIESWEADIPAADAGTKAPANVLAFLSAIGMTEIVRPGRFPMKTVMRGSMFRGFEMRTTVLELEEGPLPDELFVLPEGYTKVDPPKPPVPGDIRGEP